MLVERNELLVLVFCVVSLEMRRLDGKWVIFSLSSPEAFRDRVVFEVVADEFLIGGGVGSVLGLDAILCTVKIGLGDIERDSGTLILFSSNARFRDTSGEIFRFPFSVDGLLERQAMVASVRYELLFLFLFVFMEMIVA